MKKKVLSLVFALAACTALCTLSASAAEVQYKAGSGPTDTITFDTATGAVVAADPNIVTANIPSTIEGVTVTAIADNTFNSVMTLEEITLPDTLTSIGNTAFLYCVSLKAIDIPDSVTYIGGDAFTDCSLQTITIPKGMTSIETWTFRGNNDLTIAHIPTSVTYIGYGAFGNLTDVYYAGTEEQWNAIEIETASGNGDLIDYATIHFGTESAAPVVKTAFVDVPVGAYYEDAVAWAVKVGVTTGVTATTFQPDATCTRGQVVTFLWRSAGCPEPTTTVNPFTDVADTSYCYKAVLWAVEQGITTGVTATTFQPNATCTNAHICTFIWRANGRPNEIIMNGLPFYTSAINWATRAGMLPPSDPGVYYEHSDNCPRSDVVYALYKNATL